METACDISFIPYFTTTFVEDYVKSKSKSSGKSHIDKGYIYFREEFIKTITKGKFYALFCYYIHYIQNRINLHT